MCAANKKAVIFDLDGTVIDTIEDIASALNRALTFFGYNQRSVEEVTSFLGNGSLMLMRRALDVWDNDELCFKVRERFRQEYDEGMFNLTVPYEGIKELLSDLKEMGIHTAVVTNKDDKNAVPMIKHFFGDLIEITRGVRGDTDRKPNPDTTLWVLENFGVTPQQALFVGDGVADYEVSKNANIQFIPVSYGYSSRDKLYSLCGIEPVASVEELKKELLAYFK